MHPQHIIGRCKIMTTDTTNDIFNWEAPQRHKDCSSRNLMKSGREKCKVPHLSWNDSLHPYTLGGNWTRYWKSGGYSGCQAGWADRALAPQGSCVLHYFRSSVAGRSRKALFPGAWHWWGCIGHTVQSGTCPLQRDGRKLESVQQKSTALTRSGQRPGAHDWQGCVEAGEGKADQTACSCLKGNYKHNRAMFSSAASHDTTLNKSHRSWTLRRKFLLR